MQDGTVPTSTAVTIEQVLVTQVVHETNGSTNLVVQEPQCRTKAGLTYPAFAGIRVYFDSPRTATYPDVATLQVGDCIDFSGTVDEFHAGTGVSSPTAFAKVADPASCGPMPLPLEVGAGKAVTLLDIATDTDGANAPGASAERFEYVLMRLHDVEVQSPSISRGFSVVPKGQSATVPNLRIDNLYTGSLTVLGGQRFQSITGIYEQFDTFGLFPRTTADLQ